MTDKTAFIHSGIRGWVDEVAALTTPERILICDGSEAERDQLITESVATGELIALNQQKLPGCYLHRSAPHDVARTEHLTFVCADNKDDAGPNNNWMAPDAAIAKLTPLFKGCMKGRTMYVVPFLMGPKGSRFSKVGVEITDSKYVVLSMRIMTRMGGIALEHLSGSDDFTRCLHCSAISAPSAASSCTSPSGTRSGRSARATAAMRSSARSAWRSGWRAGSRRRKAGSRSTC
jgi:phosphoenolpyruvate carboxykinase (GTP)